jgi:hypothetical protein
LHGGYWDSAQAGLTAGDRLLLDLQQLEQQFMEKNYRQLEIEQSFSVAQFAPDKLDNSVRTVHAHGQCRNGSLI